MAEGKVDRLILVGAEMAPLADALGKSGASSLAATIDVTHVQTAAEAAECLAASGARGGDAILVKGSNSVGLGALVRSLASRER